jgi:tripartite-type tricarboxylate transporter receptor subunit TctC
MERGEVKGRCGWSWSSVVTARPAWIKEKKIKVLVQLSLVKHPDLPDVPLITDLAANPAQRQMLRLIFARQVMGRPFVAPPAIPPERLAALRRAFMQTLGDKDFLAEAAKARLEINGVPGEEVAKLVKELYATPADVARQAAVALK